MADADRVASLRRALDDANEKYRQAHIAFHGLLKNLAAELLPASDGALMVRQYAAAEQNALAEKLRALDRFTSCVVYGELPGDLKR